MNKITQNSKILVTGAGLVFLSIDVPILGPISLGWAAAPITVVFLVWMANLYNFMDGVDGLAGGMTVSGCGLLSCFAWQAHHPVLCILAILQASVATGFLVHNFLRQRFSWGISGVWGQAFLWLRWLSLDVATKSLICGFHSSYFRHLFSMPQ